MKYVEAGIIINNISYISEYDNITYSTFNSDCIWQFLYHLKNNIKELEQKFNPYIYITDEGMYTYHKVYSGFNCYNFGDFGHQDKFYLFRFTEKYYDKIYYTSNCFKSWHNAILPTGFIDTVMALLPKSEDLDFIESDNFCWFADEIPAHLLEKANKRLEEIKAKHL